MKALPLRTITDFLDNELETHRYSDMATNGLQVESPCHEISHIAFAVDCGLSVIEEALSEGAQLLMVHHGLLWGACLPLTGPLGRKIQLCMTKGLSIYASHLPLDGHMTLGNAAQLAALLGLSSIAPCYEHKGATIGIQGSFTEPQDIRAIAATLARVDGASGEPLTLPFGKQQITRVGIATGSATGFIPHTHDLGLDLLITGEPKQECFHTAKDLGCSVICMGHYASETFGVRALERVLKDKFRVETTWINQPTGI
jgi:dinuclear metal center YbgI/SA1388 family protein